MLKMNGISKSFDGVTILKNLSLEIGDAEIVSILGPSGSGKTTLLNLILGIIHPDDGEILFNDKAGLQHRLSGLRSMNKHGC